MNMLKQDNGFKTKVIGQMKPIVCSTLSSSHKCVANGPTPETR